MKLAECMGKHGRHKKDPRTKVEETSQNIDA